MSRSQTPRECPGGQRVLNQKREKHERTTYVSWSRQRAHSRTGTEILQRRSGSIYACMSCMRVCCTKGCPLRMSRRMYKVCWYLASLSLSLSLGVRVTVDVTDTTCALKHDARDLRIPKWMRPSSGAHMPRISVARPLPTAPDGDRACPYKG